MLAPKTWSRCRLRGRAADAGLQASPRLTPGANFVGTFYVSRVMRCFDSLFLLASIRYIFTPWISANE
eukprot:scaffold66210_cov73-Phaeocystis_antarctica.AAC.3